MTSNKTNLTGFADNVGSLRAEIHALDFRDNLDFRCISADLRQYFQYFGFDNTELNALAGYRIGTLQYGEFELIAHWWQRVADPETNKGTVCVAHGLFDHTGLYLKIIRFLLAQGYSVFALDMPGHGLSEGPSAEIGNFSEYVDVLELALGKIFEMNADTSVSMLGQSTGAAAVAHYLLTGAHKNKIEKAILLAPLLRAKNWWYVNWGWSLAHNLVTHVPRRFAINSNDEDFLDFLVNKDPLQPRTISLRWVGAMRNWVKAFSGFTACKTSVLILQGDDDGTVDWQYNLPIFQKKFIASKTVVLAGARHHLVNESSEHFARLQTEVAAFLSLKHEDE